MSLPSASTDDLWNTSWTAAEINDPGFGVRIRSGNGGGDNFIDSVKITVFGEDPVVMSDTADGISGEVVITGGETANPVLINNDLEYNLPALEGGYIPNK